jgi:TRAP-type uncharacterized transport system fused permease subunit
MAEIAGATTTALVGVSALACALQGRLFRFPLRLPERALLLTAAVGLIKPGIYTDFLGAALIVLTAATAVLRYRHNLRLGKTSTSEARSPGEV